jgi:hypothetical protein
MIGVPSGRATSFRVRPAPTRAIRWARSAESSAKLGPKVVGGAHHQIPDLVGGSGPAVPGRAERHPQDPDGLHDPRLRLGHHGGLAI